jgi:hypothetical protein
MQQKFGNKGKKGDDDHDCETLGTIPKDAHLLGRKDEEPWRQKSQRILLHHHRASITRIIIHNYSMTGKFFLPFLPFFLLSYNPWQWWIGGTRERKSETVIIISQFLLVNCRGGFITVVHFSPCLVCSELNL